MQQVVIRGPNELVEFVKNPAATVPSLTTPGLSKADLLGKLVAQLKRQKHHLQNIEPLLQTHGGGNIKVKLCGLTKDDLDSAGDQIAAWLQTALETPAPLEPVPQLVTKEATTMSAPQNPTAGSPAPQNTTDDLLKQLIGEIRGQRSETAVLQQKVAAATAPIDWKKTGGFIGITVCQFIGAAVMAVPFVALTLMLWYFLHATPNPETDGEVLHLPWWSWLSFAGVVLLLSRLPRPWDDIADFVLVFVGVVTVYLLWNGAAHRPLNLEAVKDAYSQASHFRNADILGFSLLSAAWALILFPGWYKYTRTVAVLPVKLFRFGAASLLSIAALFVLGGGFAIVWLSRDVASQGDRSFEGTTLGRWMRNTVGHAFSYLVDHNAIPKLVVKSRALLMPRESVKTTIPLVTSVNNAEAEGVADVATAG